MSIITLAVSFMEFFVLLIIPMVLHEFAHAFVSFKLGDATAQHEGRLTLNPLAHIDILWTLIIPFLVFMNTGFIFGAPKPVPINYLALKNPKRDIILIGASGPLANFACAALLVPILKLFPNAPLLFYVIKNLVYINVLLGVFNLFPIPPLDGSRVVMGLLPKELAEPYAKIEPYGFFIIIALVFTGLLWRILWPIMIVLMNFLGVPF